jgi:hypothetical protein
MANKTPANQGSSGDHREPQTPRVSRKVIGKDSAPYERKAGAEGGEEKKPGSDGGQAADQGQPEDKPATETVASQEAAADGGKGEPAKAAGSRKDARREAKTAERAEAAPATPAAEAAPEAQAAPEPAAAPAPQSPQAAPAAAPTSEHAPLPQRDPAAEIEPLLKPRDIQRWDPEMPAPPPAKAPPGDSRSFRRRSEGVDEFVLIYRSGSFLIRRAGRVGVMGTWTVTEYPHIGSAAHAYAQACSELVGAGFRDLR